MTVVARSHDLVLWSRVEDYAPAYLDELLYTDRLFFDCGGHLDIYPMEELPYWRVHMDRRRADERLVTFGAAHGTLLDAVRDAVQTWGPLGKRDLAGTTRVASYRGRTEAGLALYHLWLSGEVMTHGRRGFERLFDLRERVAPAALDRVASEAEAERYFAIKALRQMGLGTLRAWASYVSYPLHRRVDRAEARRWMDALVAAGVAVGVLVEGQHDPYYLPAEDRPLLEDLVAGRIPQVWGPLGSTTLEETNLLSPLDNLPARNRTRELFDFEYLWEVYKPAEQRRWGRYTMPILYGDRLVAHLDPARERKAGWLLINGFWLEDPTTADDPAFAVALGRGLAHFARFHAVERLDLSALGPAPLRALVTAALVAAGIQPR